MRLHSLASLSFIAQGTRVLPFAEGRATVPKTPCHGHTEASGEGWTLFPSPLLTEPPNSVLVDGVGAFVTYLIPCALFTAPYSCRSLS